jgi:hypothetical protein
MMPVASFAGTSIELLMLDLIEAVRFQLLLEIMFVHATLP